MFATSAYIRGVVGNILCDYNKNENRRYTILQNVYIDVSSRNIEQTNCLKMERITYSYTTQLSSSSHLKLPDNFINLVIVIKWLRFIAVSLEKSWENIPIYCFRVPKQLLAIVFGDFIWGTDIDQSSFNEINCI